MDIFGILNLLGGLALFLYGMSAMGDGLVQLSGGRLEKILEKLTQKKIMAVLLGLLVTAVIQSSSATTVMVVGFVNSGIMNLSQAVGIIMGANIGTTVTSWLLSLTGIQGSNLFLKLLKPSSFSPVLAAIGVILTMTAKEDDRKKNIGTIFVGFAILMFGMEAMSSSVSPLAQNEKFTGVLTAFSNPILGMLAGAALTAIIQSSSASVGILQALCMTGAVSFGTVTVTLSRSMDLAKLTVTDTGMGIPEEALSHIFERFYRVDKARSRQTGGSGLGLAIVRAIVSRNRGEIRVDSQVGVGTRFYVTFPIFDTEVDAT